MKYVLVLLVVGVALFVLMARSRGRNAPPAAPRPPSPPAPPAPGAAAPMLACAHCGVHLPAAEATRDDMGRAYCSAAHRLAGPR